MLNKLILFIAIATSARLAYAAAPGSTSLPGDENSVESELSEDDASGPPVEGRNLEPNEPPVEVQNPTAAPPPKSDVTPDVAPRTSGSVGEKIFDWDQHQNERTVKHPYSEKGLIRIDKDRTYYYKVSETEQNRAASFHIGPYTPSHLSNPDSNYKSTFADNYDQGSNPAVLIEYEWQGWHSAIGKFGIRVGSGAMVAQGHGHFLAGPNQNLVPLENFTFVAFPNTVGVVYRMQLFHRQLFVPYAEGGGLAFTFTEFRDDSKGPKFGGSLAAYAAAGLAINLTYFDYLTRVQLDREYGINAAYLTLEYRHILALSSRFDFTSDYFNGGFLMEF